MRNYGNVPNKPTKAPAAPPPKPDAINNFFRSGITGALFVPKMQTPEDKFFDVTTDQHLREVWLQAYIEVVKTKTRNEARMIADEALEDYLEKFSG